MLSPIVPMQATLAEALPGGAGWSYEVKWDGYRALLVNDGTRTRLISRNLKDLTADYAHIATAAPRVTAKPVLLDGEIVALDEEGRPAFQALQHRSLKPAAVVFYAFDLLHLGSTDYRAKPLRERRSALARLTFAAPILLSVPLPGTPEEIEHVVRAAGLEGVVAKRLDSIYEPGIRSRNWVKVKFSKRQEFVIGGYKPAAGAFDSVLVGYYHDGGRFMYAGKVRAGFAPATRGELWRRVNGSQVGKCPFVDLPNSTGKSRWGEGVTAEDMKALRWVKPQVVIEVAFTEWTAGGNLRHAAFAGIRADKVARDVSRNIGVEAPRRPLLPSGEHATMKTLTESAFMAWADRAGLCLDPKYPESAALVFRPDPQQDRFWEVPVQPEERPYFLLSFLELMGDWQECYVWRHLGRWPQSADRDPRRINDVVEWQILKGLGLPLGSAEVVRFERAELDKLVTMMFSTTVFGWSVGDDLYLVPDHARFIVQTDHHNVIHVSCRTSADVNDWVRHMHERGFPLPEEVPDSTFKQPGWMNGEGES